MGLLDKLRNVFRRIWNKEPAETSGGLFGESGHAILERFQAVFRNRVELHTVSLYGGRIRLDEWRQAMEIEIRYLHTVAAAAAKGGFQALTSDDLRLVGQAVERQLTYLDRWTNLLRPPTPVSEAAALVRAKLYAGAATATFERFAVLSLGVELPFYPADRTECGTNCGCQWQPVTLDGYGNFDFYWRRAKDDSCPTCLSREAACNPLRIREFITQPFNSVGTVH